MGRGPRLEQPPGGVKLTFDVSMWPLALIRMPAFTTTADIEYMQECYDRIFDAPSKHALLVDTTTIVSVPDAHLRRRVKEFEDSKRSIIREKNIGSAIVLSNPLVRGAYTALRWISPQPAPNKAFSNVRDAARWCVEGIQADGQNAPEAAYALAGMLAAV